MVASMHIELLPPAAHELVRTATTPPRQDLLHGYWNEIMVTPTEDISERLTAAMAAIRRAASRTATSAGPNWNPRTGGG